MNMHRSIVRTLGISLAPAILLGLAASCAVPSGRFQPLVKEHPASPAAEEGVIQDPGRVLAMGSAQPIPGMEHPHDVGEAAQAHYVCPMHPDVVSNQPGNCPRCGMALKEKKPETAEPHHDH